MPSTYRFFPDKSGHGGKFIEQAPMKYPRAHFTLIPYPTGSNMAIAIGGVTQDGDECKNVPAVLAAESELFTVLETQTGAKCKEDGALPTKEVGCFMSSDTFPIAKLKEPRSHHAFVPVDDGKRFLILGGFSDIDEKQSAETIELLDNNYQSQEVGTLKDAFGDLSAIKLLDGSVLVLGGRNTNEPSKLTSNLSARLEPKFDSEHKLIGLTQSLLQKGCELSLGRYNHKLVELPQRSVLVVGGVTQTNQGLSAAKMGEFYIPKFTLMSDAYPD